MSVAASPDPFLTSPEITRLLGRWIAGEHQAADALLRLLYQQLHVLAERLLRKSGGAAELQATELIAEAWLRLDQGQLKPDDRRHFMALAARVMRQVLIDQARRRLADKRGGGWMRITLTQDGSGPDDPLQLLQLDHGLTQLGDVHPRAGRAIEMQYFGGMSTAETAAVLQVTERTVERDLRFGRAWLKDHLGGV